MWRLVLIDLLDAWQNLSRKPLRSLLSGLGIGIGVAALIAMLSVTDGARRTAFEKYNSLGLMTLRFEAISVQAQRPKDSRLNLSLGITREDTAQVSGWLGAGATVGEYVKKDDVHLGFRDKAMSATVMGVNAAWFASENLRISRGRMLDSGDNLAQNNYCVVGSTLASSLGLEITSSVKVERSLCTVVGIIERKGRLLTEGTGLSTIDFDSSLFLPVEAMPFSSVVGGKLLLDGLVITFNRADDVLIRKNAEQLHALLLERHRQVEDFRMVVPLSLLREAENSQRTFSMIMGAIAALSLVVGGIGVMNIMLANIAEQTREIGLRMAVGAAPNRIISLYLCHAILLTLTGAAWGVVVGILLALAIERYAGISVVLSWFGLLLAPSFAIASGIVFGLHPARRAAKLHPALALRDS